MKRSEAVTMAMRAAQAAVVNTFIALGLTVFGRDSFGEHLLYSQLIGLSIWALVDFGRLWLITDWPTQWHRMVLIVPAAVAVGYALGTLAADALRGASPFAFWTSEPRRALGLLAMSLLVGAVVSYYFLSRESLAASRAREQAAQRLATESRLKLLESQLEPHMLFNTLANLRALISVDPQRSQQMLDHLIAYLRATLAGSRGSSHPLAVEFERLRDYLALMAIRMGPRLSYSLHLPPELAGRHVPALLLQPLVENSVLHGLEPKVDGGSLTVRARRDGDDLVLEVSDSGVGLASEPRGNDGFGLAQVRERLLTLYGPGSTLELVPGTPSGAVATARLPAGAP